MKLLFYSKNFTPEKIGVGKYNGEMCSFLCESGHTLYIVTSQPHYPNPLDFNHNFFRYTYQKIVSKNLNQNIKFIFTNHGPIFQCISIFFFVGLKNCH